MTQVRQRVISFGEQQELKRLALREQQTAKRRDTPAARKAKQRKGWNAMTLTSTSRYYPVVERSDDNDV